MIIKSYHQFIDIDIQETAWNCVNKSNSYHWETVWDYVRGPIGHDVAILIRRTVITELYDLWGFHRGVY